MRPVAEGLRVCASASALCRRRPMLAALAINWAFLVLRVAIAVVFGVIVLVGTELRSTGLVFLFGTYVLSDGALALLVALRVQGAPGFGSLLFEALVRLGMGILAFASPRWTALALANVLRCGR